MLKLILDFECIVPASHFQDCSAVESTKDAPKDRTTLVVFIGLLIDLLGKRNVQIHWLNNDMTIIVQLFQLSP